MPQLTEVAPIAAVLTSLTLGTPTTAGAVTVIPLHRCAAVEPAWLTLAEAGEAEFSSLLEQERQTLLTNRELTMHDNLSVNVQQIEEALFRLRRLEEALEGKYWDFRLSTALE